MCPNLEFYPISIKVNFSLSRQRILSSVTVVKWFEANIVRQSWKRGLKLSVEINFLSLLLLLVNATTQQPTWKTWLFTQLWWICMKRSVMLCLLVLLWCHWCYCWCFITSRVPARFPPWLCWQAALIPPTSLLTAHLSHLGPTASLVLQWVTLPLQATEGWCVPCMPNVWICCKNFSELALFLLYPSYCNALLLGWSCSWWMDFSVLEQLVSMCKEENHCFQEQNTVPGVMSCSWCTEGLQPCSVLVGSVCMLPLAASWALVPAVSWAWSQLSWVFWARVPRALCTQSFHCWAQQAFVRVFGLAGAATPVHCVS